MGGIESGSIPTAYLYSSYSRSEGIHVSAFYVRKKLKEHGSKQWTEGEIKSPCIIFEDVITTGNSVINSVTELKKVHPEMEVLGIACVIDRTDDGCLNIRRYLGVEVFSLFNYKNLLPKLNY